MRGTVLYGPRDVRSEERPDPSIVEPTDAVIRLALSCVCGSDLWPYRGIEPIEGPTPMGHEYVGVVEEVGSEVENIDTLATPSEPSRLGAASVHFAPGARTAWHTHPRGQTIYVTEGVGLCQRRGGPVEVIRPGDRAFFEPGEDHWHGAAPDRFMTHIAMQEADDSGSPVAWGEHVTDEEYGAAPAA